ncbi:small RNA-binding pol III transcript stabilizing-like protein [Encephalitozoon intestinalis ATCC 50506]|uniref:Small RNA-binding pol III transcript stabilizing-like protein n=1 Tax=Encephalitozoon intestinalis (strain ATCC 50506) TaxID=876142 RepID=E0S9C9_ENCIT|nr:small RNA-binding pol III transcript stabilizing-like protein [Encephalitozoon intestinalis ATCC 50506]ADM12193.1 small RNA-binding pol III transcript stabilizing-like protein [Encephalitozoon intestinalis ATCC 50506]UTX46000.1 La domain-containing protein [Encephalitozoon intestinalis]
MPVEKLEKIKSQVEFYFSDANFRVDKFLREQSLVNDGYIPIKTIVSFNKLRNLEATVEDVKKALEDSKVVELKDDMIKKVETEEYLSYVMEKDINKRVVYIDGFEKDATLEDIKEILSPHIIPVLIRMRRDKGKNFSGSVFAELKSEEEAQKALEEKIPVKKQAEDEERSKKQKSEEKYLLIMAKDEYLKEKEKISGEKKEIEARKALEKEFVPKLFKYECSEDLDIKTVKSLVKNTAFVDTKQKVIRMKHAEDFKEKKFEEEGKSLTLVKMEEDEALEYCKSIKIAPKGSKPGKK